MRIFAVVRSFAFVFLFCAAMSTSSPAQTFTVLQNMHASTGTYSASPLVQNRSGNLAGSAEEKGTYDAGTLFAINPAGRFLGILSLNGTNGRGDSEMLLGSDGSFYGTNVQGAGNGNIFKIDASGTLTIIYQFTGGADGGYPAGGLTPGTDGNFYGVTQLGGADGSGTVYKVTPSGRLTTIYQFLGSQRGA